MSVQLSFQASENPQSDFSPLPAGDYLAAIIDSTLKPTKNKMGEYLELMLQVLEGPHANRVIWDRLTLKHANPRAVEVSRSRLSAICAACGKKSISDSKDLHSTPMRIRVKYIDKGDQWGPTNQVASYKMAPQSQDLPQQTEHATQPQPDRPLETYYQPPQQPHVQTGAPYYQPPQQPQAQTGAQYSQPQQGQPGAPGPQPAQQPPQQQPQVQPTNHAVQQRPVNQSPDQYAQQQEPPHPSWQTQPAPPSPPVTPQNPAQKPAPSATDPSRPPWADSAPDNKQNEAYPPF